MHTLMGVVMSKIRFISSKDFSYIKHTIKNYDTFFSLYAENITDQLIKYNNILSSTLVIEDNSGAIAGFDINVLKPFSFWNKVYKSLSIFKKVKWSYSNRIQKNTDIQCSNELQDIYNKLYKVDDKIAYTLFYKFNKIPNETLRASDIGILQLKLIADTYNYQTAEIKIDNTASIKSYNKRGFYTTQYNEYEKGVLFSTIKISDIKDNIKQYKINHSAKLDNNFYECIRGGESCKLIYIKEKFFNYFPHTAFRYEKFLSINIYMRAV